MPVTININNLSIAHKGSNGISMATIPDICKTPTPAGPVPIPYPNISMSSSLAKGTKTVKVDGQMGAIKGSEYAMSSGDEPGSAGGVKSSVIKKESTWITYSFDVKMDGKNVARLTDKKFQNHQNTVDLGGNLRAPIPPSPPSPPPEEEKCPHCGRKEHEKKYPRSKSERKKALLRDADDPKADLTPEARKFIKKTKGENVPPGYEVSHEVPLYMAEKKDRCKLDKADNMKTQPKSKHRARHKRCGDQYHAFKKP